MARILLVEDEPLVRELALEYLTDAGFEVVATRDADEALKALDESAEFDALFTDIRMPSAIDGWELAAEARQRIPGLKVIYATGLADGAKDLQPDERLLAKPYRGETLLPVLAELGLSAG